MSEQKHYASLLPTWFLAFEEEAGYMTQEDKLSEDKLLREITTMINLIPKDSYNYGQDVARQILDLIIADNKSIELIAEELGVNFHDLYPYILMTEKEATNRERERIKKGLLIQFAIWTNTQNDKTFVIDIEAWDKFWQALGEK